MRSVRRGLFALALVAAAVTPAGAKAPVTMCEGEAPAVTTCSNGVIDRGIYFARGYGLPGYIGTMASVSTWQEGSTTKQQVYRCDYYGEPIVDTFNDAISTMIGGQNCTAYGDDLDPREHDAEHSCFSYDLGTEDRGGRGAWRCVVQRMDARG